VPLTTWVPWALGCEAKSTLAWDDPLPFLGATLCRLLGRQLERAQARGWREHNWVSSSSAH